MSGALPNDLPDPDPFLVQPGNDPIKPASVNQGAWVMILADQHLKQETDLSSLLKPTSESSDADLLFTWTPQNKAGKDLVSYQFSSERNSSYFLSNGAGNDQLKNTAWAGDDGHSAVMLLRAPAAGSPALDNVSLLDLVLPAFSIESASLDSSSPISTLLKALKPADSTASFVTAKLNPAPDWKSTNGTPDTPLQLPSNNRSRTPTNALWCFASDSHYSTAVTLSYHIEVNLSSIASWLSTEFGGLKPKAFDKDANATISADLTLTKSTVYSTGILFDPSDSTGLVSIAISITFHVTDFDIHVDLKEGSIRGLLVPTGSSSIVSMLEGAFNGSTGDVDMIPTGSGDTGSTFSSAMSFASVYLWYVGLDFVPEASNKLSWEFGLLTVITVSSSQKLVLALSYDTRSQTFVGRTVFALDLPSNVQVRRIDWDSRLDPAATLANRGVLDNIPQSLDIFALIGIDTSDSMIPSPQLVNARFSFKNGAAGSPTVFTIYGRFSFDSIKDELIPHETFQWNDSAIDVQISKSNKSTDYSIAVANRFALIGKLSDEQNKLEPKPPVPTAIFAFLLQLYQRSGQKTWSLHASARNLSVRLIESLFDPNVRSDGLEVLENITLASIDITYTFAGKQASFFDVTGVLLLGDLELDLNYHRSKDDWFFKAALRNDSPGSTLSAIVESIVPGTGDKLPGFVGGIILNAPLTNGNAPLGFLEFKSNNDAAKGGRASILSVFLQIAGFSLTFVQYKTRAKDGAKGVVKRILRISVDQIPMMDHIPIVGSMPQPFDHLAYLWVEDDNAKPTVSPPVDPTKLGITKEDLDDISSLWPQEIPPIQVRDAKDSVDAASTDGTKPPLNTKSVSATGLSLAKGHHFVVVVSGKVVLDHVFETNKAETTASSSSLSSSSAAPTAVKDTPAPIPEAQPTKGHAVTSAGPLSISALTFQYKQGQLLVSVDATLKLGPLTFSVIGFTLSINLTEVKLDHLADIVSRGLIQADLHGIQVGVTQGPLTLDGVFIHDKGADYESYSGGIAVGFKAWQVLAVGEYFVHMNKGVEDYKAVFVYGKLDGPLIELEFATISGVRVGFGYNYAIRMPDVTELTSFPLITDSGLKGAGNDPMVVLEAIRGGDRPFVYPQQNSVWFAAGMTITAFDVLSLTAVLVMDIDTGAGPEAGVTLAMLADGIFQMEPLAPPNLSLFYIELVVKVELNFVHGYIAADAALAPSSHIYVPIAHLTGSASFYTWFGSNPHAGDWVVSIGGYAQSYQPADWYPRPSRVGLNFTVGDNIQMIGQAYCAVTPKCAMAGGSLHMSLSVGPVSAYADLMIDAYINFKPFHFRAAISVAVGVECDIDILFVHIHVSIHLGADLVVWGPHDFGGRAHVDFWFFGFNITFGADENSEAKQPISLDDFIKMIQQPGPGSQKPATDTVGQTNDPKTLHKYSVEDGLAPQGTPPPADSGNFPSTGATTKWNVLAGTLKIRIDCGFALTKATLVQSDSTKNIDVQLPDKSAVPKVYSWPMHCQDGQDLTSEISITVRKADEQDTPVYDNFRAELVKKSASTALWRKWNSDDDPLWNPNTPDSLKNADGGTTDMVQAVRIMSPESVRAQSKIIDMDAAAAMKFTIPGVYNLPATEAQGVAFGPQYFEAKDASGKTVDGTTRWTDFKNTWIPQGASASSDAAKEIVAERKEAVAQIADLLEWTIRPPAQMTANVAPKTPEEKARSGPVMLVPVGKTANAPRKRDDGRTDWQLLDEQPTKMVGLLDIYYPALPQICV